MGTSIVGIDAATSPKKVGLARGEITGDVVRVVEAMLGSEVDSVVETIASWAVGNRVLLAVDAPLGWPRALGRGLHGHRAGQRLPGVAQDLFRRTTDRFVHEQLGKLPLEVGADRIARTAHAALGLLHDVRTRLGAPVPLVWTPGFEGVATIEVYPAATLLSRRAPATGYKGREAAAQDSRQTILSALRDDWTLRVDRDLLASSDDRLDAAVCVLAGADFIRGQSLAPDSTQREAAEFEGWIWSRAHLKTSSRGLPRRLDGENLGSSRPSAPSAWRRDGIA